MAAMKIYRYVIVLVLLICTVFNTVCIGVYASESAATEYSDVLDDLKKDPNFSLDSYPIKEDDYSLNFMQLSEGENGSIFLYYHKPSGRETDLALNKVNMSDTGTSEGLKPYDLTLVSEWGQFQKYKVEGLTAKASSVRRYLLVCAYRPFNEAFGDKATGNGTIDVSKALPIEVIWTAMTKSDGSVAYAAEYTEDIIQVTSSCLGHINYPEGDWVAAMLGATKAVDSFYYAFSTNKPIDTILEAYIEYDYEEHSLEVWGSSQNDNVNERGSKEVVLERGQLLTVPSPSWKHSYEYERIQSTYAFLEAEGTKVYADAKSAIAKESWILRFLETDYNTNSLSYGDQTGAWYTYTRITGVNLFRLKYEYKNKVYDVGVVADIKAPDSTPDGTGVPEDEIPDWLKWLLKVLSVILVILLVVFCLPLISPLASLILWIISEAVKLIVWLISLPFKLLSSIRRKNGR